MHKPRSGSESTVVRVFPRGGLGYQDRFSGVSSHVNFDDKNSLNKCLLCRTPIPGIPMNELIEDAKLIAILDAEWLKGFRTWDIALAPRPNEA